MSDFKEQLSSVLSKEFFRITSSKEDFDTRKREVFDLTMILTCSLASVYIVFSDEDKGDEYDKAFVSFVEKGLTAEILEARKVMRDTLDKT